MKTPTGSVSVTYPIPQDIRHDIQEGWIKPGGYFAMNVEGYGWEFMAIFPLYDACACISVTLNEGKWEVFPVPIPTVFDLTDQARNTCAQTHLATLIKAASEAGLNLDSHPDGTSFEGNRVSCEYTIDFTTNDIHLDAIWASQGMGDDNNDISLPITDNVAELIAAIKAGLRSS